MQTMRLFADVARFHSFSQAAELHGITQSAASQRISQLEKRLGVTLIDRSVRPLALTEAGRVFLEGSQDLIERYDQLAQSMRNMAGAGAGAASNGATAETLGGIVRVAAIYSAGIALLDQLRERFEAEYPRIHVEIAYDQPDHVYTEVLEFGCDMGILSYPERWRKVGVIALRNEPMGVVCRPEHKLAQHDRVKARELGAYEMVTFDQDLPVGRRIRRYLREHGASPHVASSFDNIDTIKNAVAVTDAFSILPTRTVSREVEMGNLTCVTLEPELVRPIGIIHRRRHKHGAMFAPAAQAFVDYLIEHAGPGIDLDLSGQPPSRGNRRLAEARS